jgi:hypothetical protein
LLLIKGYTELLTKDPKAAGKLKQAVERLETFVAEIVEIAKLEAGLYSVTTEEFDVATMIKGYFPSSVKDKKILLRSNRALLSSVLKRVSSYASRLNIQKEELELNDDFLTLRILCSKQVTEEATVQPELFFSMEPKVDIMNYSSSGSRLELAYAATALKVLGYSMNMFSDEGATRIELIINQAKLTN